MPDKVEEIASTRFPFAIDDLVPSLYSSEFVYTSCQRSSIYSLSQERITHSLTITPDVLIQPTSTCVQPSSHPLLYYCSHEHGIYVCDFRTSKAELVLPASHSSHLQRVEGDWNRFCFAHDGEIDMIDVRNPDALEMRWRYDGTIQRLDCYRCSPGASPQYDILSVSCVSSLSALVAARVRRKREEQLLGSVMQRSLMDLSSVSSPCVIPSFYADALQLLYSSPVYG